MLTRRTLLAGVAGLAATALAPLEALAASWVTLGSRKVNLFLDRDTIRVGAGVGLFTRIRLKVTGNAVFINNMRVVFANGTHYDVALRFMFLPGSVSRNIDLPGAVRLIRRVELTYTRLPIGGSATVALQGYKL